MAPETTTNDWIDDNTLRLFTSHGNTESRPDFNRLNNAFQVVTTEFGKIENLPTVQLGIELLTILRSLKSDTESTKTSMAAMETVLQTTKADVQVLKSDVQALKSDVQVLKSDVQVLKSDTQILKSDTQVLKSDSRVLKDDVLVNKNQTKAKYVSIFPLLFVL